MQHRLEKLGGRCEIHTAPGAGTEIAFLISLSLSAHQNLPAGNPVIN
jgi:signal transduction histidine kinase